MGLLPEWKLPGLFDFDPRVKARPGAPEQPAGGRMSTVKDALSRVLGGQDDPNLDAEQNAQARRQGVLQAGLGILASDKQGLAGVAEGALYGQQAGAQAQQMIYGRTQQERVANALKDPALTSKLTPQERAMLQLLPPSEAAKMLMQVMTRPAQVVAENSSLVGADGQLLYHNEGAPKLPADVETALFELGLDPKTITPSQRQMVDAKVAANANLKKPTTTNNINLPQSEAKGLQGIDLDEYKEMRTAARESRNTLATTDLMISMLDKDPKLTGGGAELLLNARSLLQDWGVDADKLSDQQVFAKLSNEVMFSKVKALGGRILNSEIQLMRKTVANLGNTPQANRLVLEIARRNAQRTIDHAALANQWKAAHDTLSGFDEELDKFDAAHPLYEGVLQASGLQAPASRPR